MSMIHIYNIFIHIQFVSIVSHLFSYMGKSHHILMIFDPLGFFPQAATGAVPMEGACRPRCSLQGEITGILLCMYMFTYIYIYVYIQSYSS